MGLFDESVARLGSLQGTAKPVVADVLSKRVDYLKEAKERFKEVFEGAREIVESDKGRIPEVSEYLKKVTGLEEKRIKGVLREAEMIKDKEPSGQPNPKPGRVPEDNELPKDQPNPDNSEPNDDEKPIKKGSGFIEKEDDNMEDVEFLDREPWLYMFKLFIYYDLETWL